VSYPLRLASAGLCGTLLLAPVSLGESSLPPEGMAADFALLWSTLDARYAYFDRKATDWRCVKDTYGPEAAKAKSLGDFVTLLERVLDELYDPHTHLKTNTPRSTRLIPSGLDVWAEWQDGRAVITELRPGFSADKAGLRPGMTVLKIGGVPVEEAVTRRIGRCVPKNDPRARAWALLALLAGTHETARSIEVAGPGGKPRVLELDRPDPLRVDAVPPAATVTGRMLDESVGYIQVRDLGSDETVSLFDAALRAMKNSRALILDLRDIPSGGNTSVAEPLLGRFIESTRGYQRILPRGAAPWTRTVAPRAPVYRPPLVVLVGRWTASMAEGMAIGLDGMGRATVVGTAMAGLNGAVFDLKLPRSGIGVSYAAEKLAHLDGTPREDFRPVMVNVLDRELAAFGDPVLEAGIRTARRLVAGTPP
jgi:C-terminal processing protease CtpA/Prc